MQEEERRRQEEGAAEEAVVPGARAATWWSRHGVRLLLASHTPLGTLVGRSVKAGEGAAVRIEIRTASKRRCRGRRSEM